MNSTQKVAKNSVFLLLAWIISSIIGFFYLIYSARYLGPANYGILSFALSITGILGILADLGISYLATREISRNKSEALNYISNIIPIKIILSFFSFLLIVLIMKIIYNDFQITLTVYLIFLYVIMNSFAGIFYSIFQAFEKMEYQAIGQILNSALLLIGAIIAINFRLNVFWFAVSYAVVGIIVFIFIFSLIIKNFKLPPIKKDYQLWRFIIKESLPLSIAVIFSSVTFRIDIVILSIISGSAAVGWYSASYKLIEILMVIPMILSSAIFPVFSKLFVKSKTQLQYSYSKSYKYLNVISIPLAVGTTFMSSPIILFLYENSFSQSIYALQILIWAIPFIFLNNISATFFISINKQKMLLKITFICMITNIILNLIFIPKFSYLAASVVTVLTEFLSFIFRSFILSKFIKINYNFVKPLAASTMMGIGIILLYPFINIILLIIISIIIYLIFLIILKWFDDEDKLLLKEIIQLKIFRKINK